MTLIARSATTTTSQIEVLGIDLSKTWLYLVGIDDRGNPDFRKKLNRSQLLELAATLSPCVVAMEDCAGSQYWERQFQAAGHTGQIIPAQFVKPYLKSNKNDFNDAGALAEDRYGSCYSKARISSNYKRFTGYASA